MTQLFFQLADSFSRLRIHPINRRAKPAWSIGGARMNPEIHDVNGSNTMFGQLMTALRRRRIRRQWQHDLQTLDDRQLRDIGVSRAEAERTVERLRFWI